MRGHASGGFWDRTGWAVLTGAVAAVGLVSAYEAMGPAGCGITLLFAELSAGPTGWLILAGVGRPGERAVLELAPAFAAALLAVAGLTWSCGLWSLAVCAVVVLTSPFLRAPARRDVMRRYGSDRAEVRREFDGIVARSFADPGATSSGSGDLV
jgi:hypothetical protein